MFNPLFKDPYNLSVLPVLSELSPLENRGEEIVDRRKVNYKYYYLLFGKQSERIRRQNKLVLIKHLGRYLVPQ